MNTIQYRNFTTVAECRSITGAARELLIAQPALTNQIKRMEEEFGATLLIRHPRSVELTDAGRMLYQTAKRILQMEENVRTEIANLSVGQGGTLRLGVTLFMPDPAFQHILRSYTEQYPDVFLSFYEENIYDLLEKLEEGIVELAIVTSSKGIPPMFDVLASVDNPLYACRAPGCPYLADKAPGELIELADLKGVPISGSRGLHSNVEEACRKLGFRPIWRAVSNARHATLNLVEQGTMVALLTLSKEVLDGLDLISNRVACEDLAIKRHVVILRERALSAAARNFIEILLHSSPYITP